MQLFLKSESICRTKTRGLPHHHCEIFEHIMRPLDISLPSGSNCIEEKGMVQTTKCSLAVRAAPEPPELLRNRTNVHYDLQS